MPIPRYTPSVDPRGVQGGYQTVRAEGGDPMASAVAQAGSNLSSLGDALGKHAERMAEEESAAKALEAYAGASRRLHENLFDPANGLMTKRGAQAMGGTTGIMQSADAIARETTAGMDPRQARAFNRLWLRQRETALNQASRHEAEQRRSYFDDSVDAIVKGATADAIAAWNDPGAVRGAIETAGTAIIANLKGEPTDMVNWRLREMESRIHAGVLDRMMVSDPAGAARYLEANRSRIVGETHTVESAIQTGLSRVQGDRIADLITNRTPMGPGLGNGTGDSTALARRIVGVESGSKADAANPASTAVGAGQFIDGTWLETIRRHRPDLAAGKSDGDLLALRTDPRLSEEMTARHAEDNAAVLAANGIAATPGNVYLAHFAGAEGARKVLTADPSTPVADLLSEQAIAANPDILPGKTAGQLRQWADAKMQGAPMPGGAGQPELAPLDVYLARLDAAGIADLAAREHAEARVRRWHGDMEKGIQDRRQADIRAAYSAMLVEKKTPDDLHPALVARLVQADPGILPKLWAVSRPDRRTDPAAYLELSNIAAKDPARFRDMDLMPWAHRLGDDDLKHWAGAQLAARNKPAEFTTIATPLEMLNRALAETNIDPTPKPDTDDAKRVYQITTRFQHELQAFEASKGKKATPEEINTVIDRMLLRVQTPGWIGSTERPAAGVLPEERKGATIPADKIDPSAKTRIGTILEDAGLAVKDSHVEEIAAAHRLGGDQAVYGWLKRKGINLDAFVAKRNLRNAKTAERN